VSSIGKVRKGIGANVRTFRQRAGLSQEKLREKTDLHSVNISQVERGAKAGKRPKQGICGVRGSFPGSCASATKARLSQQSDALVLPVQAS
jgi:DNA-binding XRE family transcriptional regulator